MPKKNCEKWRAEMMLSAHFSLEELTASEIAARAGIDNTPSAEVAHNLVRLAEGLELVRLLHWETSLSTSRADTAPPG
jgi:zinc D-Ala-D-Ala carboxypeptidase